MYIFKLLSIFAALTTYVMAMSDPSPPTMTLLYHMEVQLGERFSLGPVPNGQERIVIPIVGGTFKGPRLSGQFHSLKLSSSMNYLHCPLELKFHRQSPQSRRRLASHRQGREDPPRCTLQYSDR